MQRHWGFLHVHMPAVPYSEIKRGGPPRDGIAPIDDPVFETAPEASTYMTDHESVIAVEESFSGGSVLSRDTGFPRNYSRPPYAGYDSRNGCPFMFVGEMDDRLPATERVVGLNIGHTAVAYPFTLFESSPVINDSIVGTDIAIFYAPHTLSPFLGMFAG